MVLNSSPTPYSLLASAEFKKAALETKFALEGYLFLFQNAAQTCTSIQLEKGNFHIKR